MNKRMFPLVVAAMTAAPVVAVAQQPSRPMRTQDQTMSCDMHGMMMGGQMGGQMGGHMGGQMLGRGMSRMNDSSMVARLRAQLGLTDAQVEQMRAMEQRACAAAQPHMQMAMQAHQAAMQALQGDHPSLDHFEDQLDKAAKHMVEAQVEMARQMLAFRSSLTSAQRQKLDQMHQEMMRPPR
jgi:uncharacterized membrane protein